MYWSTSSTSVPGITDNKIIVTTTLRGKLSPENNFTGEGNSLQKNKYPGGCGGGSWGHVGQRVQTWS